MDRFYRESIKLLQEQRPGTASPETDFREIADDIQHYVNHLSHERHILIAELSRQDPGSVLLQRMGYRVYK